MVVATDVKVPVKTITCHIPVDIVDLLNDEARASCGSRAAVVRRALAEWAERQREMASQ